MPYPTQEEAYQADRVNMMDRFVICDGEVHQVKGVYIGSTGVRYTLLDANGHFYAAFPEECASCWFGGLSAN